MLMFKDADNKIFSSTHHLLCHHYPYTNISFEESFDIPLVDWLISKGITNAVFVEEMGDYDWKCGLLSDGRDVFCTKLANMSSIFVFVPYLHGFSFRVRQELRQLFPDGIEKNLIPDNFVEYEATPIINVHKMVVSYLMTTYDLSKEKAESFLPKLPS